MRYHPQIIKKLLEKLAGFGTEEISKAYKAKSDELLHTL